MGWEDELGRIDKAHEALAASVHEVDKKLEFHMAETHEDLVQKARLVEVDSRIEQTVNEIAEQLIELTSIGINDRARIASDLSDFQAESRADRQGLHRQMDEIADVVLGTPHRDFDGNVVRSGGMKALVSANDNGGIRFKYMNLIVGAIVTLLVAFSTLAGVQIQAQVETERYRADVLRELNQLEQTVVTTP